MTTENAGAPRETGGVAVGDASAEARWPPVLAAIGGALLLYVIVPLTALGSQWGLVNYDDPYLVADANPAIGKGLLAGLPDLLLPSGRFMDAWLPLYYWSLGLDHALFGDWWLGWHLHSAVLHALGAALVVLIAREIGLRNMAAATAGLIFALHPAATESVAWIASRKDQLSFVWAAAAMLCYLRVVRTGRARLHAAGALLLAVAFLAKGTVVVVPLLLAVHAWFLRGTATSAWARLRPVLPYAAVALVMSLVHLQIARTSGTAGTGTGAGLGRLLVADVAVVWMYARSLFVPWPGWGSVEHGLDPYAISATRLVLGAAVIVAWIYGVLATWRTRRGVAAALLAVPLALAPFNNVLPRTSVLFAERYVYIALLPLSLGLGAALASRLGRATPFLAAALLGGLAAPRIGVWQDSVALWRDAQATAPGSAFVSLQLADAYAARAADDAERAGDWRRLAEEQWRAGRRLAQNDLRRVEAATGARPLALRVRVVQADTGLGTFLLVTAAGHENARERVEEAVAVLGESVALLDDLEGTPGYAERLELTLTNRAGGLEALGRREAALLAWKEAAQRLPESPGPLNALARLHLIAGRAPEALAALAASARVAPGDPLAAKERADIRLGLGDAAGAKREIAAALAAHPGDADLLVVAGHLDLLLLRPLDAASKFRHALELRPGDGACARGWRRRSCSRRRRSRRGVTPPAHARRRARPPPWRPDRRRRIKSSASSRGARAGWTRLSSTSARRTRCSRRGRAFARRWRRCSWSALWSTWTRSATRRRSCCWRRRSPSARPVSRRRMRGSSTALPGGRRRRPRRRRGRSSCGRRPCAGSRSWPRGAPPRRWSNSRWPRPAPVRARRVCGASCCSS